MNKEALEAAEGLSDGTLVKGIIKSSKYALTGFAIGAIAGVILAAVTGKSKLMFAIAGGTIAGGAGYLMSPNEIETKK